MKDLTIGKIRGLQQLSNSGGVFKICSLDHRRSLRRMMNMHDPASVAYQAMVDFKLDLCEVLSPLSGAVLLDPIYSASQAIASGKVSGNVGLLISLEAAGYDEYGADGQLGESLVEWNVEKLRNMGASAVKIPLYYRPDMPNIAAEQLRTVTKLAYNCQRDDIALFVGPRNYIVPEIEKDQWEFARKKPGLIIETVRQLSALPIDVLKVEFPADISYQQDKERLLYLCQQLDDACRVPWVLLSGGVDFDVFTWQLEIACKAGASGFIAGRALWQEAVGIPSRWDRMQFLKTVGTERLSLLMAVADESGKPWLKKLAARNNYVLPDFEKDWEANYALVHENIASQ